MYIFDEPDASLDVFRQREIIELLKRQKNIKLVYMYDFILYLSVSDIFLE